VPDPKPVARPARVFISGPISRGDLAHNVNQATAAFVALAKAGLAPFCPHWSVYSKPVEPPSNVGVVLCEATVHGNDEMTHADWLGIDLAWVAASDALLRLPGESVGADMEVAEAVRLGIHTFTSVEQVVCWAEARRPMATPLDAPAMFRDPPGGEG
jgi:hypothetical protein